MAIDITRHHHERYDGTGYPDRLAGNAIPLAARIVAICDVYDALRARRSYKPALSHTAALQMMSKVLDRLLRSGAVAGLFEIRRRIRSHPQ